MFGGGLRKRVCPIGIDFGTHSIKMLQLQQGPGSSPVGPGWIAIAAAARPIDPQLPDTGPERDAVITELIREMYAEGGFVGRTVATCLPYDAAQYKNLRLPRMPENELRAAVEYEAADRMFFEGTEVQLEFLDAGEVQQGDERREEIILLAADTAAVESHVAILKSCKLDPQSIEVAPLSLTRCLAHTVATPAAVPPPQTDGGAGMDEQSAEHSINAAVVIDMGGRTTKVLVLRGDRIVFFKTIDVGGAHINRAVSEAMNMSESEAIKARRLVEFSGADLDNSESGGLFAAAEREQQENAIREAIDEVIRDLTREIQLCLRYYGVTFRGRRPESAAFVGGESRYAMLADMLSEGSGIRVQPVSPLGGVDLSKLPQQFGAGTSVTPLGHWAVATGLSMRTPSRHRARGKMGRARRGAA